MYAVAFDLVVEETEKRHPKGVTQAYTEIGAVLGEHGFRRVQGSLLRHRRREHGEPVSRYPGAAYPDVVSKVRARHSRVPHRTVVGLHCRSEKLISTGVMSGEPLF